VGIFNRLSSLFGSPQPVIKVQEQPPATEISDDDLSNLITSLGATGTRIFGGVIDTDEYVAALKGDKLFDTIDQMRWGDAQVRATTLAVKLPIMTTPIFLVPGSSEPFDVAVAKFIHESLFRCGCISNFMRHVMLHLDYGHMTFEKIYETAPFPLDKKLKLRWKYIAPRLPRTISKWDVNDDELEAIWQFVPKSKRVSLPGHAIQEFITDYQTVRIESDKLMVFTHNQEGSNFRGTSLLRGAYAHWYFKNLFYKIDAIKHERYGVGIPILVMAENYDKADVIKARAVLEGIRSHEKSYAIIPPKFIPGMWPRGFSATGAGGAGSVGTEDIQESINHHNMMISTNVLGQFMDLGRGRFGSRNLGESQINVFLMSLQALADYIEGVLTQHIRHLVDLNWQDVEVYPSAKFTKISNLNTDVTSRSISRLVQTGALTAEERLEEWIREIFKVPQRLPASEGTDEDLPQEEEDQEGQPPNQPTKKKSTPPRKNLPEGQTVPAVHEDMRTIRFSLSEHPSVYKSVKGSKTKARGKRRRVTPTY